MSGRLSLFIHHDLPYGPNLSSNTVVFCQINELHSVPLILYGMVIIYLTHLSDRRPELSNYFHRQPEINYHTCVK